ncbi:MAG: FecR domain-containing protein [Rhodocyclaceae bacterium]|nr:FecR domain-containing protein [Rhodocyclaceae bacterium]
MHTTFTLKNSARMALAISMAFPVAAYAAPAGRVDFVAGAVTSLTADGRSRTLGKGDELNSGETIQTGSGRVQLRYTDGSQVSLQPGTQYRIDDYRYEGKTDGDEKGFFSLLKGSLRTVTGLVGKVNRQNYKITTSVATIGIRGTEFKVESDNDGVRVSTGEGLVEVCNKGGCIVLARGEQAVVINAEGKPVRVINTGSASTNEKPGTPSVIIDKTRETDIASTSAGIPGYAFAVSGLIGLDAKAYSSGTATINTSTGVLTQFVAAGSGNTYVGQIQNQQGTDSIISWGEWAASTHAPGGGSATSNTYTPYVTGVAATNVPTSGTVFYTLSNSTIPSVVSSGGVRTAGAALTSGSLTANFGSAQVSVYMYSSQFPMSGSLSASNLPISGVHFSGSTTGPCISGASVSGIFVGANAARAGVTYQYIDQTNSNARVSGSAVFTPGGGA